jgi:hypothetical protein
MITIPEVEEVTDTYSQFCHVSCLCSPLMTLCGGYKPEQCGLFVLSLHGKDKCPKCNKPFCPDCDAEMENDCGRCGV